MQNTIENLNCTIWPKKVNFCSHSQRGHWQRLAASPLLRLRCQSCYDYFVHRCCVWGMNQQLKVLQPLSSFLRMHHYCKAMSLSNTTINTISWRVWLTGNISVWCWHCTWTWYTLDDYIYFAVSKSTTQSSVLQKNHTEVAPHQVFDLTNTIRPGST